MEARAAWKAANAPPFSLRPGRQPGPVDGGAHQCLAGGLASLVEIIIVAVFAPVPVNRMAFARKRQLGEADIARMHLIAVFVVDALIHHLEGIA